MTASCRHSAPDPATCGACGLVEMEDFHAPADNSISLAEAEDLFPDAVVLMDVQIPRIIHGEYFELMRTWMGGLCARNGLDSASWHPQVGAWVTCSIRIGTSTPMTPSEWYEARRAWRFGHPASFVESLNERILQEIKILMPPFLQLYADKDLP